MLITVSTRKFRRAVRLPEGDVLAPAGAGVSKSAASRHFVALSAARMKQCEALEFALDGFALDRCGHERSQERLSQAQSLHATSGIAARPCRSLRKGNKTSRSLPNFAGRLTSF